MAVPLVAAAGAVEGLAKTIGSIAGIHTATPRIYGKLPGTIVELREGVEGKTANLNGRTYNDVETVQLMDTERRTDSTGQGMQGIWDNYLPTWNPTSAARAAILKADPTFYTDRDQVLPRLPEPMPSRDAPALAAGPGSDQPEPSGLSSGPMTAAGSGTIWWILAAVVLFLLLRK